MENEKVNCWEFMKCGKEKTGGCPVTEKGAGKACWLILGTVCEDAEQNTFAEKVRHCSQCRFYWHMKD